MTDDAQEPEVTRLCTRHRRKCEVIDGQYGRSIMHLDNRGMHQGPCDAAQFINRIETYITRAQFLAE